MVLYKKKRDNTSIRIIMAEQLEEFATDENHMQLFKLFQEDEQAHVRMIACKIASKMKRHDLIVKFEDDKDGHIRKCVKNFLSYTGKKEEHYGI